MDLKQRHYSILVVCMLISVGIHIAILSLQGASPSLGNHGQQFKLALTQQRQHKPVTEAPAADIPAQPASTLQETQPNNATVQKSVQSLPAAQSKNQIKPEPAASKTAQPAHVMKHDEQHVEPPLAKVAQSTASNTSAATSAARILHQKTKISSHLQQAMQAHFYYPKLAIRRGWQGAVKIGLHIQANGKLSELKVVRSSGHGILDRAALHSLQQVNFLPAAVALLNGQELDLVLPVKFQLL